MTIQGTRRDILVERVKKKKAGTPKPPQMNLASLDAKTAAALISSTADITIVMNGEGTIAEVAFGSEDLEKAIRQNWPGRRWIDLVTVESRTKIKDLLKDAGDLPSSRWRQVNHPSQDGADIPIVYSVVRFNQGQGIIAVGRDQRGLSALQQKLIDAQKTMEREYNRIRDSEKRYRLLLQLAREAVLIIDAESQKVLEANPSALALLGLDGRISDNGKVLGSVFSDLFDKSSRQAALSFVSALRVAARIDNVHVHVAGDKNPVLLSGSLFRQEKDNQLLVLLSRTGDQSALSDDKMTVLRMIERLPDAFVITDMNRRVLLANPAFVDLVQMANEEQLRGTSLDRWLGRSGMDVDVLFANLRSNGLVRHFSTTLLGEFGASEDVDINAVTLPDEKEPRLAFSLRNKGWRSGKERLGGRELPRTVEQFTDLVGRVPLKNLVRETADLIERLCIEAALELTRDNRAAAAEMLGLSRQGLYSKMHRYGLGSPEGGDEETAEAEAD